MRREKMEHLVTTGIMDRKLSRGRPRGKNGGTGNGTMAP